MGQSQTERRHRHGDRRKLQGRGNLPILSERPGCVNHRDGKSFLGTSLQPPADARFPGFHPLLAVQREVSLHQRVVIVTHLAIDAMPVTASGPGIKDREANDCEDHHDDEDPQGPVELDEAFLVRRRWFAAMIAFADRRGMGLDAREKASADQDAKEKEHSRDQQASPSLGAKVSVLVAGDMRASREDAEPFELTSRRADAEQDQNDGE